MHAIFRIILTFFIVESARQFGNEEVCVSPALSVRIAMKKGEKHRDKHAYRGPKTDSSNDQHAENNYGEENHHFHSGHVYTRQTGKAAEAHHADKSERQLPDRTSAQLRRPNTDREHGQEMIPSVQRMIEAVIPAVHGGTARMRVNERGHDKQRQKQQPVSVYSRSSVISKLHWIFPDGKKLYLVF
jgi:hypothetical protein